MSISLKRKKIFQKEKRHSSVFWKAFQISTNYFSLHRHFNCHIHIVVFAEPFCCIICDVQKPNILCPCKILSQWLSWRSIALLMFIVKIVRFKVAEHCMHTKIGKNKCGIDTAIILFAQIACPICALFHHDWTVYQNNIIVLAFYYKLPHVRKGNNTKNPAILGFFLCYRKNPVKCSQKIAIECQIHFLRNMPISREPLIRISQNLAGKY